MNNKTFELKDKTGRIIYLTKERWSHIRQRHSNVIDSNDIEETLKNPVKVISDEKEKTKIYYRYFKHREEPAKYLKVIVKYLNAKGFCYNCIFCKAYFKMKGKMSIYYDEEGDYLDIFVGKPRPNYGEEVAEDITIFRDEKTDEIIGIGILNFRKRAKNLQDIKLDLPIDISLLPA